MALNPYQRVIADHYAAGDYAHIDDPREAMRDDQGDTLFTFLMREMDDPESPEEAYARLRRARDDLQDMMAEFDQAFPYEPNNADDLEIDLRIRSDATMHKHFVTFVIPGTFFTKQSTQEIPSWDTATALEMAKSVIERYGARPYAFQFSTRSRGADDLDSKVTATSPNYFFGCDVYNLAEVEKKFPDARFLITDMRNNADYRVAVPREGCKGFYSVRREDIILP